MHIFFEFTDSIIQRFCQKKKNERAGFIKCTSAQVTHGGYLISATRLKKLQPRKKLQN